MPQSCAVPMCSNRIGGHKFPKDEMRLKQWLIAIRRDKYTPSAYSRICKDHFSKDDYELPKDSVFKNPTPKLKISAVPSIFPWNKATVDSSHQRKEIRDLNIFRVKNKLGSSDCAVVEFVSQSIQNSTSQNDAGIQCGLCGCHTNTPKDVKSHQSSYNHNKRKQFLIDHVMDINNPKEVQFFTGFQNFDHFKFVFSLFGDEVNHLKYYPHMKTLKHHVLSPFEEFLLTVIKLKRNKLYTELAFRFKINKVLLRNIFITWINYLYCKFKDLNNWAPKQLIDKIMKYTDKVNPCTVIIDCTQTKIQPQTITTYKSCNTFKVLVGISISGLITFVSDAYDECMSDSELFKKCVCIGKLQSNDSIHDYIEDSVCHEDASINIPECLKLSINRKDKTDQLSANYAFPDITHVKRLFGLARTFKFLSGKLDLKLLPLADRIIFVCFMLNSFRSI